jgi:hypothetical protein
MIVHALLVLVSTLFILAYPGGGGISVDRVLALLLSQAGLFIKNKLLRGCARLSGSVPVRLQAGLRNTRLHW